MNQVELCAIIYQLLIASGNHRCTDISMDNDNDDGEIILNFDGVEFIIKPKELEE